MLLRRARTLLQNSSSAANGDAETVGMGCSPKSVAVDADEKNQHCAKDQPGLFLLSTGLLSKMTCFRKLRNKRRKKDETVKGLRVCQKAWRLLLGSGPCFSESYLTFL